MRSLFGRNVLVLGVLLATPFALGTAVGSGDPSGEEVLRFQDPAIVESSGLVMDAGRYVTVNDSGDIGRVYTVSQTGRTVGLTSWAAEPIDVEALAPAGPGQVWVGDIGDNRRSRASISVTRVPVGAGTREVAEPSYALVYPDGARDAEALLAHPGTGRLYVVSKVVFGGGVYEAPAELDTGTDNPLRAVGEVTGLVTDGAFFPDGRHLVLRTYTRAVVYTFPGFEVVDEFDLPQQQQGEGLAVVGDDTIYLTSEGLRAPVLRVILPGQLTRAMATAAPGPAAGASPSPSPTTPTSDDASDAAAVDPDVPESQDRETWWWWLGAGIMVLLAITLLRALRPR